MFFDPILVRFFEHSCVLRQWNIVFGRCSVSRPVRPKQEDFVGLTTYFASIQAWIWECVVGPKRIVEMFFDHILLRSSEHFCLLKQRETSFFGKCCVSSPVRPKQDDVVDLTFKLLHSNRESGNYWLVLSALWRCSLIYFFIFSEHSCLLTQWKNGCFLEDALFLVRPGQNRTTLSTLLHALSFDPSVS